MVNLHRCKDTQLSYAQLAVRQDSGSFSTKLLPSLLSQALEFVELHDASDRPLLHQDFQSIAHLQTWERILTHHPGCWWEYYRVSALTTNPCGTSPPFRLNYWCYPSQVFHPDVFRQIKILSSVSKIIKKKKVMAAQHRQVKSNQQFDFDQWLAWEH